MKSLSPVAPRTMMTIAASCFLAGLLLGAWIVHLVSTRRAEMLSAAGQVDLQDKFSAKIVGIVDGDTVQALTPGHLIYAIRLAGVDAPESAQPFGRQSTQHLSELIFGKTVNLECKNERDDYGRLVCKILLQPSGEDVCLDQLKAGLAWHYKQYQDEQSLTDRATYAAAECTAMKAKTGLWGDPRPVQPQDFRHGTNSPLLFDTNGCRKSSQPTSGAVLGNSQSHIFQWPGCPYYSTISPDNQVPFPSPELARAAGYRPARNCP
jgi:endonuclease YncB( thermonuclease family)